MQRQNTLGTWERALELINWWFFLRAALSGVQREKSERGYVTFVRSEKGFTPRFSSFTTPRYAAV